MTFSFQNCGESFQANESNSFSSFCKTQPKIPSPFSLNKNQLKLTTTTAQQKLSQSNTKAALVINTQCYFNLQQDIYFLDNKIQLAEKYRGLETKVFPIEIPPHITDEDIDLEIEKTNCLIGIADNPPVFKGQSTVSPPQDIQARNQGHLNYLGYYQSLSLQADVTKKVVIAIVDTGVDYTHDDLKNKIWENASGTKGINTVSSSSNSLMDDDSSGHGTHVAGIVAAEAYNGSDGVGLAGNFAEIMIIKALDASGAGSADTVADGIAFAVANGADIINLSLQAPGTNTILEAAVTNAINAGVVITVSAGNQEEHITSNNLYMPAYLGPLFSGVLSVAAVDTNTGNLSSYSNYGDPYAEIGAPGSQNSDDLTGGGILSTVPGNSMARIHGTSQAAPMVAASAAMIIGYLKTKNVKYTPSAIESYIKSNGSAKSFSLSSYISDGNLLHQGLLASNLFDYFNNNSNPNFNGDNTAANNCFIK